LTVIPEDDVPVDEDAGWALEDAVLLEPELLPHALMSAATASAGRTTLREVRTVGLLCWLDSVRWNLLV
jgi:hypothetical protein